MNVVELESLLNGTELCVHVKLHNMEKTNLKQNWLNFVAPVK